MVQIIHSGAQLLVIDGRAVVEGAPVRVVLPRGQRPWHRRAATQPKRPVM